MNKILRFSESEDLDSSPFTNWFVTACETLTNNVQALINSGIIHSYVNILILTIIHGTHSLSSHYLRVYNCFENQNSYIT